MEVQIVHQMQKWGTSELVHLALKWLKFNDDVFGEKKKCTILLLLLFLDNDFSSNFQPNQ